MKVPRVVTAMNYLDDDLISDAIEYSPKKKKPVWMKWSALAACLCLVVVTAFSLFTPPAEEPQEGTDFGLPANFTSSGSTYFISPYLVSFEVLPNGFSKAGEVEISGIGKCPYFVNSNMPEWIYVYHEIRTRGEVDATGTLINTEPHLAYVRYVDERLRGKDLLCVGDKMYISMWSVNLYETPDITWEYHDAIDEEYGNRIEGMPPEGFELAGIAEFSGYDSVPSGELTMNTDSAEVYLSKSDPNIALVDTHWYTAPQETGGDEVRHDGFNVYVLYDCPFTD